MHEKGKMHTKAQQHKFSTLLPIQIDTINWKRHGKSELSRLNNRKKSNNNKKKMSEKSGGSREVHEKLVTFHIG